jgi:hypothetical protein
LIDEHAQALPYPPRGVTTNGTVPAGVFLLHATAVSAVAVTDAAVGFLGSRARTNAGQQGSRSLRRSVGRG